MKKVMMIHLYKDFRQNNQIQGGILLGVQRSLHSQIYREIKNFKHIELSSQRNGHINLFFHPGSWELEVINSLVSALSVGQGHAMLLHQDGK